MLTNSPTFEAPPVVERGLSVQFEELPKFDPIHFGRWHQHGGISEAFPKFDPLDRIPPIVERFPSRLRNEFGLRMDLGTRTGAEGFWSEDDRQHMLLQPDRLSLFWRCDPSCGYDRFEVLLAEFAKIWSHFAVFATQDDALSTPRPTMVELRYVNSVIPGREPDAEAASRVSDLMDTLGLRPDRTTGCDWLPEPSVCLINRVYDFPQENGKLYVEAAADRVADRDHAEGWRLVLTARIDLVGNQQSNRRSEVESAEELAP